MKKTSKFDLSFIVLAALIIIILNEFLLDSRLHWITYLLLISSYFIGRFVEKKVRDPDQSKATN